MTLPLNVSSSTLPARTIRPRCLQQSAPVSFSLSGDNGKPVKPTLAGYALRRGEKYRLEVSSPEPKNFVLTLTGPRWLVESQMPPGIGVNGQDVTFHTGGDGFEVYSLLPRDGTLDVALQFHDGREPHRFSVPVFSPPNRVRWALVALVSAILGGLISRAAESDWQSALEPSRLAILGLIILAVVLVTVSLEVRLRVSLARKRVAETQQRFAAAKPNASRR